MIRPTAFAAAAGVVALVIGSPMARAATPAPTGAIVFSAPAGSRPMGPPLAAGAARILPSGRLLRAAGTSVAVGSGALGVALAPGGRFALVSSAGATGTASLAVVDARTMRVLTTYADPAAPFFGGIAAVRDPRNPASTLVLATAGPADAVIALDLDATGRIVPDAVPRIAIPAPPTAGVVPGRAFPDAIAVSADGSRAYVTDALGGDVSQIDVATRTVDRPGVSVGFEPFALAVTPGGLLVANEGVAAYRGVAPVPAPRFGVVPPDLARASSVARVPIVSGGALGGIEDAAVPLDHGLGGVGTVGGVHPAAVVAMTSRPYAFLALAGVDRVATIDLSGAPVVTGGSELRLYDRGPYGTQPDALALGPDGRRLYVALAGIDAIAVLDTTVPNKPHRIGLIPTGVEPSALALSRDGKTLFVANAAGLAPAADIAAAASPGAAERGSLERIDLQALDLRRTTPIALATLRTVRRIPPNRIVPQTSGDARSDVIAHVVTVHVPSATYDAAFGVGATADPNLRALARAYAVAGNFYADAATAPGGLALASAGIVTAYTRHALAIAGTPGALPGYGEDPVDYPRAGYLFDSLAAAGRTYRDAGDLLWLAGYAPATAPGATGGSYTLDVPALAALEGHVDLGYPGLGSADDLQREAELERDLGPLLRSDRLPDYVDVWFSGAGPPGTVQTDAATAVTDRALGRLVALLSHATAWTSTALFVVPTSAAGPDRVDPRHSYVVVVSPWVRHGFIGHAHLSTASVLKTEDELLGLPALSLGDALATDFGNFFGTRANSAPFEAIEPGV